MAKQPLKGTTQKTYEVVNNFSKGYATSVADDLLNENVFSSIVNFIPGKEGNIQKRPGLVKSNLYNLFLGLKNEETSGITVTFNGYTDDTTELAPKDYIFSQVFLVEPTGSFVVDKLLNLTIIEDYHFLEDLQEDGGVASILNGTHPTAYLNKHQIHLLLVFRLTDENGNHFLRIAKLKVQCSGTTLSVDYEIKNAKADNTRKDGYSLKYNGDNVLDLTIYHNYYYFVNGTDAIIRIHRDFMEENGARVASIDEIYSGSNKLYKPTAIEVANIGFNILATDPLSFVDVQGTADAIRGVYYTLNGEPTQTIPFNKEFQIHILQSGSSTANAPQYRPDNGDVDTSTNPYKTMPGSFNSDHTIFTCTGLDLTGNYEIKVTKGSVEFINYFTMGTVQENNVGKVSDIKELIFSSKYCKVINNQLVLYGGHGYIFFSEYDNFEYYPNYFYVYVAETNDEYVVNISYFRQYYAIFTNKRLKRMTGGFGTDNFGVYPLNDFVGCKNGHTVKQIENYLYFLSDNGMYALKQGYIGEGTENVQQMDLSIYGSYNPEKVLNAVTVQNYYIVHGEDETLFLNYVNDAFYKCEYTKVLEVDEQGNPVYSSGISVPFQYTREPGCLYYGFIEKSYSEGNVENEFDIMVQDFNYDGPLTHDNWRSFNSDVETSFMSMGYPTNMKKFKQVYLKLYTDYGKFVPLYVTIIVDDIVAVSPTNYEVVYNEETKTYYYIYKTESNKELKGYHVLGTLELGEDIIGKRTLQVLKFRVGKKGRAIKVILSDAIPKDKLGYTDTQNINNFELAAMGIVYKLKKVKEG